MLSLTIATALLVLPWQDLPTETCASDTDEDFVTAYHRDGFAVVRNFVSESTVNEMVTAMSDLIEDWDPQSSRNSVFHVNSAEGSTGKAPDTAAALERDKYLFNSADGVGFFLNPVSGYKCAEFLLLETLA